MKSIQTTFILTIVLALFSQSCRKGSMWAIRGEGESSSQTRDISGFSEIDLSVNADIQYTQDSLYFVEVTAQKNILTILETKVAGNSLNIDFKRNVSSYQKIKIIIHSPNLNRVNISSSGSLNVQNSLKANNLFLSISGSAYIGISNLSLQNLSAQISGSGKIIISGGTCKTQNHTISGSGIINTEFVNTNAVVCNVSGSGSSVVTALETLNVNISGSGNVQYHGKPSITKQISGSGNLIALD